MDGQIWALKAKSLTSPLTVTVTVTEIVTFLLCVSAVIGLVMKVTPQLFANSGQWHLGPQTNGILSKTLQSIKHDSMHQSDNK